MDQPIQQQAVAQPVVAQQPIAAPVSMPAAQPVGGAPLANPIASPDQPAEPIVATPPVEPAPAIVEDDDFDVLEFIFGFY